MYDWFLTSFKGISHEVFAVRSELVSSTVFRSDSGVFGSMSNTINPSKQSEIDFEMPRIITNGVFA